MARRWWYGLRAWIEQDGAPLSLAILPLHKTPGGLRSAVARLRRALRDTRDRRARRQRRWRGVAMVGMADSGGIAFVLVRHQGLARSDVSDVLGRRWPEMIITSSDAGSPCWRFAAHDAAELAQIGRGIEPLRIVVPAQRRALAEFTASAATPPSVVEPLPIFF